MKNAALFWSAGKDSAMALYKVRQDRDINLTAIVCTLNKQYKRVSMHGISENVLDRQCEQLEIPLIKMWVPNEPDNNSYEIIFLETCRELKNKGIDTIIFGDIFLEDLRQYREHLLEQAGLEPYFPLWKIPAELLIQEFFELGFEAITCCVSTRSLNRQWIGRNLDLDFFTDLPFGVDACGENGEFHTFCFAGPVFKHAVPYQTGEVLFKTLMIRSSEVQQENGFLYLDIL